MLTVATVRKDTTKDRYDLVLEGRAVHFRSLRNLVKFSKTMHFTLTR